MLASRQVVALSDEGWARGLGSGRCHTQFFADPTQRLIDGAVFVGSEVVDLDLSVSARRGSHDRITLPGSGHLLAVAGWRGGEPTNGLYESRDAGNSFTYIANPNGWVPAKSQGRNRVVVADPATPATPAAHD